MTWTIRMSEKELQRKTWIDKAIDKRISQKAVADTLEISERQARRLISRYRERGDIGLVSGSRGRPRNRRLNTAIAEKIKQFISEPVMIAPIKQWIESNKLIKPVLAWHRISALTKHHSVYLGDREI